MSVVDSRYGSLRVIDTDFIISRSLTLYGEWAQREIDLLSLFISSGDVVIDAGSFIGTHALAFGAIVGPSGRVLAFEPRKSFAAILRENIHRANSNNVELEERGLGTARGCVKVPSIDLTSTGNFGASDLRSSEGGPDAVESVDIVPLDTLMLPHVDFIKMDVEGMEIDVLRGGEKTLTRSRPIIFLETNSLDSSLPVLGWAHAHEYLSFGVLSHAFNPANHRGNPENAFGNAAEAGMLLLPAERWKRFETIIYKQGLPQLRTADDLAALLLLKPQYPWEVLNATTVFQSLGPEFPSPFSAIQQARFDELMSSRAAALEQVKELGQIIAERSNEIKIRDAQVLRLNQSLQERNAAIATADIQVLSLSQKLLERDVLIAAIEEHARSLEQQVRQHEAALSTTEEQLRTLNESIKTIEICLAAQDSELRAMEVSLSSRDNDLKLREADLQRLNNLVVEQQHVKAGLAAELAALGKSISDRDDLLANRNAQLQELDGRLAAVVASRSWWITKPLRAVAALMRRGDTNGGSRSVHQSYVESIPNSDWQPDLTNQTNWGGTQSARLSDEVRWLAREIKEEFDVAYYLSEYPDVAETGVDPVEHYIRSGAAELRNPNRRFSTKYYWESNPDVKASGINPFLHFVWTGRREGRLCLPPGGYKARHLEILRPLEQTVREWYGPPTSKEPLSRQNLSLLLEKALESRHRSVLSFSHDNYTASTGGVQLCLQIEQCTFKIQETAHINLHPLRPLPVLAPRESTSSILLEIILDGAPVGTARAVDIAECIERFTSRVSFVLVVHALHGHTPEAVMRLARAAKVDEAFFWIHDYFSLCAGYNLLRNGISYCGAPPVDSSACTVCLFGEERREHVLRMQELFSAIPFTVLAPSVAALEIWECSGLPRKRTLVLPHCRLDSDPGIPAKVLRDADDVVRVAFLGHPALHKGWPVFERLLEEFKSSSVYEFHYLGKDAPKRAGLKSMHVEVTEHHRSAMADAVSETRIDFAVLWSIWPETFSFASFEALAGGARVLTFRGAGNVARLVSENGLGHVFGTEDDLLSFFQTGEAAREAADGRNARRTLRYSGITAEAFRV